MVSTYRCPMTEREIISYLEEGYSGACKLLCEDKDGKRDSATFLSVKEAERAASRTMQQDRGGYIQDSLHPATD